MDACGNEVGPTREGKRSVRIMNQSSRLLFPLHILFIRMHRHHHLVAPYVDNIFEAGITFDSNIRDGNYDLLIVTPGPTVNELGHCIQATKSPPGIILQPEE